MAGSCNSSKKAGKTKSSVVSQIPVKKVILNKDFDYLNYKKEFTVTNASIKDSLLTISFNNTGCSDDDYNMVFNGNYLKSLPPKASLFITKQSGSKDCGKKYEKTLVFDVSTIKYPNNKTIVLMFPNYEKTLLYNY